ncbi:putative mitochondrial protein [Cardamine amara subsp. amara]|uniref:Mitochondrial protein n=1 Tax=Cardamine amara subsp. amara TaxID=228776 RepID=A0ABD1AMV6_CARAN
MLQIIQKIPNVYKPVKDSKKTRKQYKRLDKRYISWHKSGKNHDISLCGKETLIKAVALSMPVYAMSCFKLTKTSISNLTSAICDFWWNSVEAKQKIHWVSWDKLCLSKENGGLGFRDLECFNQALLAKQAWRLIQDPDSLFARIVKIIYFLESDFLEALMGARP